MKSLFLIISVLSITASACFGQCQVLDDFTTGKYKVQLSPLNATATNYSDPNVYQLASVPGGKREAAFEVSGGQFGQTAEMSVAENGNALTVTSGTREFFRVDLVYGQSLTAPLRYFPVGCDRFRVSFDASSQQGINFNTVVWQGGGPNYSDGINVFPTTSGQPFCVDFLFQKFVTNAGPYPQSFASKGIDMLDFVLQSGAAAGANSFAITKIETLDGISAAAHPCAFVAP